ncbi:esterase-like activity of phytase family protein [Erythrobacter sp. NE805]|uniref:esterase-like activity of phytase family protein n=1 Tax=Erythrobacter sp. NE805 TaxID=3389875 RepID=UPI00396B43B5
MRRLLLLALVVVGLAPGTFLRTLTDARGAAAVVTITPRPERAGVSGELALTGVWELRSAQAHFGGFSTLAHGAGQALVAGSDRSFLLDIDLAGGIPRAVPGSFRWVGISTRGRKEFVDLESLARDPASGTLWAGFEAQNLIVRYAPDGRRTIAAPPAMAEWGRNSGAETMERLADGRFLVIAEGVVAGSDWFHEALLFPGDPVAGAAPARSTFKAPPGYDPVDAAQLPDGRVLILLRAVRYRLPAEFDTMIAIADPREMRPGKVWEARIVERLNGGIFADNFEGITFVPSAQDPAKGSIWLVVDDNFSVFQRSLLVRFDSPR